jgi:hypothetical protein
MDKHSSLFRPFVSDNERKSDEVDTWYWNLEKRNQNYFDIIGNYKCLIKWVALFKSSLFLKIDLHNTQTLPLN